MNWMLVLGAAVAGMGIAGIFSIKEKGVGYYCARANFILGVAILSLSIATLLK